jgi:DNA-binding NarL/FixJ family response regulator
MNGRRVVIADDDLLLREGVSSVLAAAGYEIVGHAGDAATLETLVRDTVPDVAVIDIRMPPTQTWEGLDAARSIRAEFPEIAILLLSAHIEVETAIDLLEAGERIGYLLKTRILRSDDFVDALDRVCTGGSVVDPALVHELVVQRHRNDPLAELTAREKDVLTLMAEGLSNAGIAGRLYVTDGAVEKHVRSILAKLNLSANEDDHRRVLAVLTYLQVR